MDGICFGGGSLRGESFIAVLVAIQDDLNIVLIEQLPKWAHAFVAAMKQSRRKSRMVPERQRAFGV